MLSFVVDNLISVLNVMNFHMRSDRAAHYEHVEMMVKYETTFKLVHRKVSLKKSAFVTKYRYWGK